MDWLINILTDLIDFVFKFIPFKPCSHKHYKIVAHRGWHNNKNIKENTISAFDLALENNLWGIEFDIRWTKDLVAVVHHDSDCKRVWGRDLQIGRLNFEELRREIPEIPTLEEVIQRYGKKIHFFIELKKEFFPSPELQNKSLIYSLRHLEAGVDYHFLCLDTETFEVFGSLPKQIKILVGTTNLSQISQSVVKEKYAGIMGHYLLMNGKILREHSQLGSKVGTGHIRSKNVLHREVERGIEFIFTNHPWNLL